MASIRTIRKLGIITAILATAGTMAIAGSVSPTIAQEYLLRLEGGPAQIDTTSGSVIITLDVIGDIFNPTGPEFMMWGSFSLETSGSAVVEGITWTHADWSEFNLDGGYTNDGNYAEVEFGQWEELDWTPPAESAIGLRIGSFQITLAQGVSVGAFHADLIHGERYSLSTLNVDTGASYYSTPDTLVLEGYSTDIVPAPGSLVIMFGAGLVGARRKR